MAGIGFELRKILKKDRLLSLAKVYGYSAILSSGPWVISIVAILIVGFLNLSHTGAVHGAFKFQVVITYAIALASSLILTGILQLPFTRYIADLIFKQREEEILPSYFGAIILSWTLGLIIMFPFYLWLFDGLDISFILGALFTFMVLCGVWISSILAASLKYYTEVVWTYLLSYTFIVVMSYFIGNSLQMLLYIFFIGNAILFIVLMSYIIKSYPSSIFLKVDFFLDKNFYWTLAIAGLAYNLGAWVDKFVFWYNPATGHTVIGKLNASIVYDMPIFLAYFSILPGMAIFFFRLEADFAEKYELYYDSVRNGGTLALIKEYRDEMTMVIRQAIREILIIQGTVDVILFLVAPRLFDWLNISVIYLGLFYILTIGALLQLAFMSTLAILYYLDRKKPAMWLSLSFFVLNGVLSWESIQLGTAMYGYGYTISLLIVFAIAIIVLREEMKRLNYETFMLQ